MGHSSESLGRIVISAALLLACCTPAAGARVSSGLLADAPGDLRQDVEIASRAAEAASRRLQQEAATARLLPPEQVQFVVSGGSSNKQILSEPKAATMKHPSTSSSQHLTLGAGSGARWCCSITAMRYLVLSKAALVLQNILQPALAAAAQPGRPGWLCLLCMAEDAGLR